MKKQLEWLKSKKLLNILKAFGAMFALVILFGIYNAVILGKSAGVNKIQRNSSVGVSKEMSVSSSLRMPSIMPGKVDVSDSVEMEESSYDASSVSQDDGVLGAGNYISTPVEEKRVIKNGFLTLKVEDTDTAAEEVSKIVSENGGEIFSSNFNEYRRGSRTGAITVKIPVDNFQKTIKDLKGIATQVVTESTSGQDVTERYVDLKAQLKNKRAEEETFVSLLDRSGKLDDVLKVTQQISRVRGEIERLEGKIKYLESQTSMSTIAINISEDIEITPIDNDWRPAQIVKKALNDLKKQSQDFVESVINFIIVKIPSFIPFAIFVIVVYWIGKKIYLVLFRK